MKVPTTGTEVFKPSTRTGTGADATITSSTSPVDTIWTRDRSSATGYPFMFFDRLRGRLRLLYNNTQNEQSSTATVTGFDVQNGYKLGDDVDGYGTNISGRNIVDYNFRRASGFFDVVCYTGTGANRTVAHNLTVVPELMIVKNRLYPDGSSWAVYANNDNTDYLLLNTTAATADDITYWNDTSPTSSVFTVGTNNNTNKSTDTFVAYLFATCAGVSKVGSYTGNGGTQAIACGFTGGARFMLIKRTDDTGDWYVYDTARGMTLLTNPYLELNTADAEAATLGSVTTTTGGFTVDASILAAINTNAASYIFLAIA
jgi:hypothetical protein